MEGSSVVVINLAKAMHLLGGDQYGVFHDDPGDPLGARWLGKGAHIGEVSTVFRQKLIGIDSDIAW